VGVAFAVRGGGCAAAGWVSGVMDWRVVVVAGPWIERFAGSRVLALWVFLITPRPWFSRYIEVFQINIVMDALDRQFLLHWSAIIRIHASGTAGDGACVG